MAECGYETRIREEGYSAGSVDILLTLCNQFARRGKTGCFRWYLGR